MFKHQPGCGLLRDVEKSQGKAAELSGPGAGGAAQSDSRRQMVAGIQPLGRGLLVSRERARRVSAPGACAWHSDSCDICWSVCIASVSSRQEPDF